MSDFIKGDSFNAVNNKQTIKSISLMIKEAKGTVTAFIILMQFFCN